MSVDAAHLEKEFQTGISLIQNGKAAEAESTLLGILPYLPDNPTLIERIGYACALQQNWPQAEKYYLKAAQLSPTNSEILNNFGCVLQKQDRWNDALPYFSRAYDASPNNLSALSNLAQTLNHCGRNREAIEYYEKAVQSLNDNIPLRFQLATLLHEQQHYEQEAGLYRQILALDPNNARANLKLAIALFAADSKQEAYDLFKNDPHINSITSSLFDWARHAHEQENFADAASGFGLLTMIYPDNSDYWRGYVIDHYFAFGLDRTIDLFKQAIEKFPDELAFQRTLTIAYGQAGMSAEAVETARKLVERGPDNPKTHQNYAVVLRQHQKAKEDTPPDEAAAHFNKALELAVSQTAHDSELVQTIAQSIIETKELELIKLCEKNLSEDMSDSFPFHMLNSFILTHEGNPEKAVPHAGKCAMIAPNNSFAMSELSDIYFRMEDYDNALEAGRKSVEVNPRDSQALMRLGHLSVDCGLIEEGLDITKRALAQNPHDPSIHLSLGLISLLTEDWEKGWKYYSARFRLQHNNRINIPPIPKWDGVANKDLLLVVICEQGLGDIIQFSRFLPVVSRYAAKTIFLANPSLAHMFGHFSEFAEIVPANQKKSIQADHARWVSVIDIPRLLDIPQNQWGNSHPYLQADADNIQAWGDKIGKHPGKLKVGIAWQGSPGARIDVGRSIPLKQFEPLSKLDNIQLINLQKFFGEEQLEQVSFKDRVIHLGENFDSGTDAFRDTMAVMENLDLIISSDTAMVHLAGALGKPVWLAAKHVPDWRWGISGARSIWYPSMRLFRQSKPGQWGEVFETMAEELGKIRPAHSRAFHV